MIGRASYNTEKTTPAGTTDAILREELCVPSVEATMAGQAVRARTKYKETPGLASWLIKSRPPPGATTGAWPGTMETKAKGVSDWFGLTAPAADWQTQPAHLQSKANKTVATMGDFPDAFKEAAAAGPMNAATFDAAAASTSKIDGRRMRMLANEQHFRRTTCPTTNTYAMSGLRQSAKAFLLLAGLHPTLATGFHYLATARHGTFQTWQQVRKQHGRNPAKYQIGSDMAAEGCPCCNNANVADSLGHFIFECDNLQLKQIRADLRIKEFATQLTAEVTRQQQNRTNNSSSTTTATSTNSQPGPAPHVRGGTRVTRSAATSQADTMATLLIGGRLNLQSTGSTAATSTSQPLSVFDLRNWQQVKGNAEHAALKAAADKALDYPLFSQQATPGKKKKKLKKVQSEHPLFESSTVLLARYLQAGIGIRSKLFWKSASSQRSNVGQS